MSSVINIKHGFYFLHIPKTAGRSIESMLMSIKGSELIDVSYREKKRGIFCTPNYAEWRFTSAPRGLKNKLKNRARKIEEWHNLFKFCFVRNPYDRAYSGYKYCIKTSKGGNKRQPFGQPTPAQMTFSHFLRLPGNYNYEIKNHLHITQSQYMAGINTKMDFIGKLENIEDDLGVLAHKLGVVLPKIEHKNSTKSENDQSFKMSVEDKKLIDKMFNDDFVNFGYTK